MITPLPDLPDHVLGFHALGRITGEDYERVVVPAVEAAFARRPKLSLLYQLGPTFEGFDAAAAWDDAKLGLRHLNGWERVALVTDVDWIRAATRVFALMIPAQVRIFGNAEIETARTWVGG